MCNSYVPDLQAFYNKRLDYLKSKSQLNLEKVDFTQVTDPYLSVKAQNPIMIIGEAPGANEVQFGEPFIGMAGKNLMSLITLANLNREKDILITNAFPFRTFETTTIGIKNRTPNTKELTFGATLLIEEIEIVKPRLILILGGSAKKAFLKLPDLGSLPNLNARLLYPLLYLSPMELHFKIIGIISIAYTAPSIQLSQEPLEIKI